MIRNAFNSERERVSDRDHVCTYLRSGSGDRFELIKIEFAMKRVSGKAGYYGTFAEEP